MTILSRRAFSAAVTALAASLPATRHADAQQGWPERPVTMIVPFPAGASTDVVARLLGEDLRTKFSRGFVVENKVGAGGNIAASGVARATPDGYTLFMSSSGPLSTNKLLYRNLTYDPLTDFEPISLVGDVQCVVAVHRSVPVSTLRELIAYGKANPGKLTFGSPGYGLMGHIAGEMIQRTAGFQMTHVPYRGSAPLSNDLVAGNVNVAVDFLPPYIPHVKAGSIKAIAVTSDRRAPQIPETPTLAEAGLPGINVTSWFALAGPKGVPQPIVRQLSQAITESLARPEIKARLEQIGVRAVGGSPDDLRRAQAAEIVKWSSVIRDAGISLE
jgi:tripartite-type tricarboxylate transporter receptor subunit TctC